MTPNVETLKQPLKLENVGIKNKTKNKYGQQINDAFEGNTTHS